MFFVSYSLPHIVSMSSIQLKELLESIPTSGLGKDDSKNVSFALPSGHDSDSIFEDNGSEKSHTELMLKVSKLTDRYEDKCFFFSQSAMYSISSTLNVTLFEPRRAKESERS